MSTRPSACSRRPECRSTSWACCPSTCRQCRDLGAASAAPHRARSPQQAADRRCRRASRGASLLARAAENPLVFGKVSGLYSAVGDPADWTVDGIRPIFDHALEVFGPDRLMYGGDWPVSLIAGGYDRVFAGITELLADLDESERARILAGTAADFYSLDLTSPRLQHRPRHRPRHRPPGGDLVTTSTAISLARLGEAGREIPVVQVDGRTLDARSVTADFDGAFFASDGIARTARGSRRAARARGCVRAARRRPDRPAGQDRLHRPQLPRPRRGDRGRPPGRARRSS